MINFKTIAIATTITISSLLGAVTPATAGTCWFRRGPDANRMGANYCSTSRRVNANGHVVFDIVDHKGTKSTFVFWTNDTVEIIGIAPRPIIGRTWTDRDGDIRIEVPSADFEMAIRL